MTRRPGGVDRQWRRANVSLKLAVGVRRLPDTTHVAVRGRETMLVSGCLRDWFDSLLDTITGHRCKSVARWCERSTLSSNAYSARRHLLQTRYGCCRLSENCPRWQKQVFGGAFLCMSSTYTPPTPPPAVKEAYHCVECAGKMASTSAVNSRV